MPTRYVKSNILTTGETIALDIRNMCLKTGSARGNGIGSIETDGARL